MALDEPTENDNIYEIDGNKYIVEKTFMEKVAPIKIDFSARGYKISCGTDFEAGCSSCGTKGSCCS